MTAPIKLAPKSLVTLAKPQPPTKTNVAPKDELSTGKGQALRTRATQALGSPPFSRIGPDDAAGLRVTPLGRLESTGTATGGSISSEKRRQAEQALSNALPSPTVLADRLRAAGDDAELRRALVVTALNSDAADSWLSGRILQDSRRGLTNEGYDDLTAVASAVGEAYQAGNLSDQELRRLASRLGPEQTSLLVQTLGLGSNGSGDGGVVEALGAQAASLGYNEAAALAFTSSPDLIAEHLPDAASQRAAFQKVEAFIERFDQERSALDGDPVLRNAVGSAVVNAARLTANGNGYSEQALRDELKELGPKLAGEIIGQASERSFNGQVPGPLDVLGDASARLARETRGDDAKQWQVNSAIAYTQSPALLAANLPNAQARQQAFATLNQYLAESRGEWSLARRDGYTLVRGPQAVEGINLLLEQHPEMLTAQLDAGPSGEADLVQLFESVALIPDVPQAERDRLQQTIEGYVASQLRNVQPGNANDAGARVGRLFGTLQVAASRAVADAEAGDNDVRRLSLNFVAGVAGVAARVGLTASVGPLGAGVSQVIVDQVLRELFHTDPPSQAELEAAVVEQLTEAGIDVPAGERGHDRTALLYRELHDALTQQLAQATDPAVRARLTTQLNVVQGVLNGLDVYGDTIDSSHSGAELANELNRRRDEP